MRRLICSAKLAFFYQLRKIQYFNPQDITANPYYFAHFNIKTSNYKTALNFLFVKYSKSFNATKTSDGRFRLIGGRILFLLISF